MSGRHISARACASAAVLSALVLTMGMPRASEEPYASAQEHATPSEMVAQNGATVPTPEIDTLTCDEMNRTLMEISATGYRGVLVVSENHPDYRIFAYENRLATAHYEDCQVGIVDFTAPRSVFSQGFN